MTYMEYMGRPMVRAIRKLNSTNSTSHHHVNHHRDQAERQHHLVQWQSLGVPETQRRHGVRRDATFVGANEAPQPPGA